MIEFVPVQPIPESWVNLGGTDKWNVKQDGKKIAGLMVDAEGRLWAARLGHAYELVSGWQDGADDKKRQEQALDLLAHLETTGQMPDVVPIRTSA